MGTCPPPPEGASALGIVPPLSAAQGMNHDEDKKHKVDVKHAAVDSLCF